MTQIDQWARGHTVARACFRDGEALESLVASAMNGFL
jgi:hypothetical protein